MAGHSHWAGIKHKKGRQDKVRSKLFSKLSREITVSAKMGLPDPSMNPRLRSAIQAARVGRVLEIATDNEMRKVEKNFTFLATVGSTAPFIGLFGTVWGIMNSFQSIAISRNTSLAIVAPGIAEALFATALGLLAAIPAVVFYNKLSGDSQKIINKVEEFSEEFSVIISRHIDMNKNHKE